MFIHLSLSVKAQDIFTKTIKSMEFHSDYGAFDETFVVKNYFLSERDFSIVNGVDITMKARDSILNRYSSFNYENGCLYGLIPPHEIYALKVGDVDTFNFVQPIASYNIDRNKFTSFELIQLMEKSRWQELKEVEVFTFISKEFKECIKLEFPFKLDIKSDQLFRVDEVWIIVKNRFRETMEMRFKLK